MYVCEAVCICFWSCVCLTVTTSTSIIFTLSLTLSLSHPHPNTTTTSTITNSNAASTHPPLSGVGEEGCGPGVEREVVEGFSKGLVTSEGTEDEHVRTDSARTDSSRTDSVLTSHDKGDREDVVGRESVCMTDDRRENKMLNIDIDLTTDIDIDNDIYVNGRLKTESDLESDNFALFRASDSKASSKILYLPVPVKYQQSSHSDPLFLERKNTRETYTEYGGKNNGNNNNNTTINMKNENNTKNGNKNENIDNEDIKIKPYDVKVSRLLRKGFKAFGQLVGHFVLRKIASSLDEQREVNIR